MKKWILHMNFLNPIYVFKCRNFNVGLCSEAGNKNKANVPKLDSRSLSPGSTRKLSFLDNVTFIFWVRNTYVLKISENPFLRTGNQ